MAELTALDPYDWSAIAPYYMALQAEPLTIAQIPGWLARWNDLERVMIEARAAAHRAKTEDTTNAEAEQRFQHLITVIRPQAELANQTLRQKLLSVEHFEPQTEHRELLRRLQSEAQLFRQANVQLQADEQARASSYHTIMGAMIVTLDGEEMTIPQAQQRLFSPDRQTREAAWRAIMARQLQDHDALCTLFLDLFALRRRIAAQADCADYRSYKWRELKRFDYSPEDSQTLHAAVEAEIVPLAVRMAERRRQQLGIDHLRPWDALADPLGRQPLQPFQSSDELEAGVARILARLDPELGTQFERLRNGFLDLASRKGKALVGYQSFFALSGMPYIFMNAVGIHLDVQILLHEAGHACHALLANAKQPLIWNTIETPMEFKEVASQAMELLATPYLASEEGGFYTLDDARRALHEQLDQVVQLLRSTVVDDIFQHWIYTEAPSEVTAADLDAKYRELHARFYPEEDWSGLEAERGSIWQIYPHIIVLPFYMIEYTVAQLGALQIWRNALQDQGTAVDQYKNALALGATRPLPELYQTAGAHLAFDRATVADLAQLIATKLDLN